MKSVVINYHVAECFLHERDDFFEKKLCLLKWCLIKTSELCCELVQLNASRAVLSSRSISENSGKLYVADLANDVHCNFPPEALINAVSSYEAAYWLEQISYNFLI